MKRSAELAPLSREHHEALVLARRACEPQRADPATVREQVLQRWVEQFEPHFAREEQVLLPALQAAGAVTQARAAAGDHERLRVLVDALRDGGPDGLPAWGEAMRAHVQWEERYLFPLAERLLDLPRIARDLHAASSGTA